MQFFFYFNVIIWEKVKYLNILTLTFQEDLWPWPDLIWAWGAGKPGGGDGLS